MTKPWFIAANWVPWVWETNVVPINAPMPVVVSTSPVISTSVEGRRPLAIPGLVGELVDLCWRSSYYQLPEVALASALSCMAALCGRTYAVDDLGLNLYILVLAGSSTGKSFANQSNKNIKNKAIEHFQAMRPSHDDHFAHAQECIKTLTEMFKMDVASGAGIAHHMSENPSSLFYIDEFVNKFKTFGLDNAKPYATEVGNAILQFVEVSGPTGEWQASAYSKRIAAKEIKDVKAPAFSILANSIPKSFYDELNDQQLESGLIPRFVILEYEGSYPRKNANRDSTILPSTLEAVIALVQKHVDANASIKKGAKIASTFTQVAIAPDAQKAITRFEDICWDMKATGSSVNAPYVPLWARAEAHALKIAALIAIGCNYAQPTIQAEHFEIAVKIVRKGLDKLTGKVEKSEVGFGDNRQMADLKRNIAKMFVYGASKYAKLGMRDDLAQLGIMQQSVLRNMSIQMASFRKAGNMAAKLFDDTVRALLDANAITEVPRSQLNGFTGKSYYIDKPTFDSIIGEVMRSEDYLSWVNRGKI